MIIRKTKQNAKFNKTDPHDTNQKTQGEQDHMETQVGQSTQVKHIRAGNHKKRET